ncbi:MAG: hypothetical protein LAE24_00235 [Candidatus Contendobacter sp.]|nr:hypothetical protein [Candidatus Contendobacter sp.]
MTPRPASEFAFRLDRDDVAVLNRLAGRLKLSHSAIFTKALAALENRPAPRKALVIYAHLAEPDRVSIRLMVRQMRSTGGSFAAIGKRLYVERNLCGTDNMPLGASTIRGMCAV